MNIANGIAWLKSQVFANEGASVTYERGSTSATVTAVRGRTEIETDTGLGALIRADSPDYLIQASDLTAFAPPVAGDRITDSGRVFVATSQYQASPWQWADWPNRTVYRIHTKQVDTA